jgi:hypothetical protein
MGPLARRLGRHRPRLAGAAGLIAALAAPAAAEAAPRLASWERVGELERDYGPEGVIVFDGITETVRARGHTVHASTGGELPPRLVRLLNLLSRLHDKYLARVPVASR